MARTAAVNGGDELRRVRSEIDIAAILDGDASADLHSARVDLQRADDLLGNPLLLPLRPLPVIGRQIQSGSSLTSAGVDVVDLAIGAVDEARAEIGDETPTGEERIALLRKLESIAADARVSLSGIDLGPRSGLIGPLARARNSFVEQVHEVDQLASDGETAAAGLAELLQGPSTYLVLAANNAEMRAGSGMILSVGLVQFDKGELELSEFEGSGELALPTGVGAPPELERLYGWATPDQEWRSLGLSPRFPVTAELASRMWSELGRFPVDGVLSVDINALALVLEVTGPVDTGEKVIDRDNVYPFLLHDQYEVIRERDDFNDENVARSEQLSTVASSVLEELESSGLDLALLADNLQAASATRSLLAWSAEPTMQGVWETLGVDGDLESDSLLVGVANRGGNKLDQYLDVVSQLELLGRRGDLLEIRLTVAVTNRAPIDDLPYVIGFDPPPGLGPAGYAGIVTVNLPAGAHELNADGETLVASGPDGPTTHAGLDLAVAAGETDSVSVDFVIRESRSEILIEPDTRVPAMRWVVPGGATWDDSVAHRIDLLD